MRRWTILNVLLGVLVAVAGYEIARTWARSLPDIEVTPRAPAALPEPEKQGKGAKDAKDGKERGRRGGSDKAAARAPETPAAMVAHIADHELFDPTRQKPGDDAAAKAAAAVKPEINPPAGVTLVGIRIQGRDTEAFITDANQGNKQRRVRPGDQIAGYAVKGIEHTKLMLTSPTGDPVALELGLDKSKATKAGGKPVPKAGAVTSPAAGLIAGQSPAAGVGAPPIPVPAPPQAPPPPTPPQPVPPATTPPPAANPLEALREQRERMRHGARP